MKEEIKKVLDEKEKLKARIKDLDNFIEAFQKICEHDMEYDGHDSHKDHYICTKCGEKDYV